MSIRALKRLWLRATRVELELWKDEKETLQFSHQHFATCISLNVKYPISIKKTRKLLTFLASLINLV